MVWLVGLMVTQRNWLDMYPYAQWGGKSQAALDRTVLNYTSDGAPLFGWQG